METRSKIIQGSEIEYFDIVQGKLYVKRNSDVVVMATQVKAHHNDFSAVIVSGYLDGWGLGHNSIVWSKKDFKPFDGIIQIEQFKEK